MSKGDNEGKEQGRISCTQKPRSRSNAESIATEERTIRPVRTLLKRALPVIE